MSLITATVGHKDANCYVTETEANTYFLKHPEYETWDKIYTSTKERWLVLATRLIDMEPIDGDKLTTTLTSGVPDQALRFPRGGEDYVPVAVKEATFEQAIHLSKTGTTSSRTEMQDQGVIEVQSGDGWREKYKDTVSSNTQLCAKALTLLNAAGLIKAAGGWA